MRRSVRRPVRRAARAAALLAVAAGLAATDAGAREPRRLLLATWENYVPADVLADFEKENGCTVRTSTYGSNDELLAKMQRGTEGYDVAVPSDMVLPAMIAQGLLERLDRARLPNLAHLDPAFLSRESDPKNEWSVPYAWGTAGLAWRTDKLGDTVDSWGAFADPRASGNAFLLEESRDAVGAALLFAGHDVNSTDAAHLADAKRILLSWKPHLKGFSGEVKDQLASGEAWLMQAYNGDVAQARLERKDIAYAVPKEGGIFWVDNLVIPKGAQQDLAHAYLDFVMRPEIAARISNGILYAVPNKDAMDKVDPAVLNDPVVYAPADVRARCRVEKGLGADSEKLANLWAEVRSTSGGGSGWLLWAILVGAALFGGAFAFGWLRGRSRVA